MKIYYQDNHWRGAIIVVANTEEEARDKMKSVAGIEETLGYKDELPVYKEDIRIGLCIVTCGDM